MPRRLFPLVLVLVLALLLAGFWQSQEASGALSLEAITGFIDRMVELREVPWFPLALAAIFVLASLAVFPLSILVALTGMIYGPWLGLLWATVGTLLAAAATFWVGHGIGREPILRHGGARVNALAELLQQRGVRTTAIVALLPLAPFTVTNMLAGAFRIRFRDFMLGTTAGILPGLVAVILLGSELLVLLEGSEAGDWLRPLLVITLALAALAALRLWIRRRRAKRVGQF